MSKTASLKGVMEKGADLSNFGNECVRLKAKKKKTPIVHKHCTRVKKVVFHGDVGEQF